MTTDTKAVARWDAGQGVNPRANGKYVLFTDHERVVGELHWQGHAKVGELANEMDSLRTDLAASRAEVEGFRKDAERWDHARKLLSVDDIAERQRTIEEWNYLISEDECKRADEAIDAAMGASA